MPHTDRHRGQQSQKGKRTSAPVKPGESRGQDRSRAERASRNQQTSLRGSGSKAELSLHKSHMTRGHPGGVTAEPSTNTPATDIRPRSVSWFSRFSKRLSSWTGRGAAFALALALIIAWGLTGPLFDYNDSWQLVINTSTTIVTFLMVFLIQNTQNRDTEAMQIKLDEIIRATQGSHNALLDLEELDEEELARQRQRYLDLAQRSREKLERGLDDVDCPPVENGLADDGNEKSRDVGAANESPPSANLSAKH